MNLINIPDREWTHSFGLPSHWTVGPTACDPSRDAVALKRVAVTGLPLPVREDFGPDAFGGKCFVRLPRRTAADLHISGRVARYPWEQPVHGADSMWLPDYCVIGGPKERPWRQPPKKK